MNADRIESAEMSVQNGKRAIVAMCKVSIFLIAVTLLSDLCAFLAAFLLGEYGDGLLHFIVKALMLMGADKTSAYTSAKLLVGSEAFAYVINLVTTFVSLVLPCIVFAKIEKVSPGESFNLKGRCVKSFVPLFCLCHLFTTFASVFAGNISSFMLPDAEKAYAATGVVATEFNVYMFVISVLCSCVFVPIVEEFVFRGVIFSYLRRFGLGFGVMASAVVFGIAHVSPSQSVYAFVFGLVSAVIFAVTGNIKTSIIFHALNNFLTVSLGYLMGELPDSAFNLISGVYLMVVTAIGIYGLYALCRDGGIMDAFREKEKEQDGGLLEKCGIKHILVFPVLMYLAYYAYGVVVTVM